MHKAPVPQTCRSQLVSAQERFTGMLSEADLNLASLFRRYDETADRTALDQIRAVLNRRRKRAVRAVAQGDRHRDNTRSVVIVIANG